MDYFTSLGITAETMAYAYSWGFGTVVLAFVLGYSVGVAKKGISMM